MKILFALLLCAALPAGAETDTSHRAAYKPFK